MECFDGGRLARPKRTRAWPVRQVSEESLHVGQRRLGRDLPDIEPYPSSLLSGRVNPRRWPNPYWAQDWVEGWPLEGAEGPG